MSWPASTAVLDASEVPAAASAGGAKGLVVPASFSTLTVRVDPPHATSVAGERQRMNKVVSCRMGEGFLTMADRVADPPPAKNAPKCEVGLGKANLHRFSLQCTS